MTCFFERLRLQCSNIKILSNKHMFLVFEYATFCELNAVPKAESATSDVRFSSRNGMSTNTSMACVFRVAFRRHCHEEKKNLKKFLIKEGQIIKAV